MRGKGRKGHRIEEHIEEQDGRYIPTCLDIVENSIRAGAAEVRIEVREDRNADLLTVEIRDDGEGMSDEMKQKALDPFYTSKENKRVGLGIPLLMQSACEGGGAFVIRFETEGGNENNRDVYAESSRSETLRGFGRDGAAPSIYPSGNKFYL